MNKDLVKEKWLEVKPKVVVLLCLIGAFVSGFLSGNLNGAPPVRRQLNYTTNNVNKPLMKEEGNKTIVPPKNSSGQGSGCPVKGSSSRIYHLPGGAFYDRTNAQICFKTEAEAQAAGFRKSSR